MRFRVLGCHGGSTLHHRNVSFLVNERVALDAGSLAVGLSIEEQTDLEWVLLTHSHLDHIGDLGAVCDVRAQRHCPTLRIAALAETVDALDEHFFNDVLWPDFSRISMGNGPVVGFTTLSPEEGLGIGGLEVRAIRVDHSVPSCGFVVSDRDAAIVYTGDTAPTERIWRVANETPDLRAVITEVSYPDRMAEFAIETGHLTPALAWAQLQKLSGAASPALFVYGMKPAYVEEVEAELRARAGDRVRPLAAGEVFEF